MILYINTAGKNCEVALMQNGLVVDHLVHEEAMQHSTVLHNHINKLLEQQSIDFNHVTALGIMNGPGSYTGLRIGLAAAKGFCYALDVPLLLFNKLDASCDYYLQAFSPVQDYIGCIEPARTGEYFFCIRKGDEEIFAPSVYESNQITDALKKYADTLLLSSVSVGNEEISTRITQVDLPLTYISEYLFKRLLSNNIDDLFTSEPFYLKKVHANTPKRRF